MHHTPSQGLKNMLFQRSTCLRGLFHLNSGLLSLVWDQQVFLPHIPWLRRATSQLFWNRENRLPKGLKTLDCSATQAYLTRGAMCCLAKVGPALFPMANLPHATDPR